MNKFILTLLAACIFAFAGASQAMKVKKPSAAKSEEVGKRNPVKLEDASPIIGTWILVEVAPRYTGERIPENRTWEFRSDGTLKTSGYNRHFKRNDEQEFHYEIKNGNIVTDVPGRPGKTLIYRVYDMGDDYMVLQGGVEGFYFFKRK